jgi:hypothetical protein
MPFKTLIVDEKAVALLAAAAITAEWLTTFELPKDTRALRRIVLGERVYILSTHADLESRLLVVDLNTAFALVDLEDSVRAFDRVLHVALATFEAGVAIPLSYHSFREGSRLSIYAARKRTKERIYFEQRPCGTDNLFLFAITPDVQDLAYLKANDARFKEAYNGFADALLAEPDVAAGATSTGITLTVPRGALLAGGHTLQDWYDRVLTKEQRKFVDRDLSGPVRLMGAAGTGKTLAMAVKCLRDFERAAEEGKKPRYAFITYSTASVTEIVRPMLDELDPQRRYASIPNATIEVASLYELAQRLSKYEEKLLEPLSLDGRDGREFQKLLILDALESLSRNTRFVRQILPQCSDAWRDRLADRAKWDTLSTDLMHEFAGKIDAERIRLGFASADEYLRGRRERWQMSLDREDDRLAVLEVHDAYCKLLESNNVLSMDQMISDLNGYLLSHEWARLRERVGYDVVFVDELHYFNRAERMVFHSLFKRARLREGEAVHGLPLFMAYDLKQSTSDAFLSGVADGGSSWVQALKAGPTERDELTEVFRYSPQIAQFLTDLDAAFPALDLAAEWLPLRPASSAPDGDVPELQAFGRNIQLLDAVFDQAEREAREKGGRNVAVLCLNEDMFARYLEAGRISDKYVAIESRDKLSELKYMNRKCIFSMPDYVAGMQFESVYLMHLDQAELGDDRENIGIRRRLISRVYLGASRARSRLVIAASHERGGPSEILERPIGRASLQVR